MIVGRWTEKRVERKQQKNKTEDKRTEILRRDVPVDEKSKTDIIGQRRGCLPPGRDADASHDKQRSMNVPSPVVQRHGNKRFWGAGNRGQEAEPLVEYGVQFIVNNSREILLAPNLHLGVGLTVAEAANSCSQGSTPKKNTKEDGRRRKGVRQS